MSAAFAASATLQKEATARRHSGATWTRPWPGFPQIEDIQSVPIKKSAQVANAEAPAVLIDHSGVHIRHSNAEAGTAGPRRFRTAGDLLP